MRYLNAGFASALLLVSPVLPVLLQGEVVQAQTVQDRRAAAPVLAQAVDQRKAEADRLKQQGIQQYQTSQYEAALQSWEQALTIYKAIQDRNGEANALNNLGVVYQSLSQYDKAITYHQQALPLFQQVQDRNGEAKALNNLGGAYQSLSQYDKAIGYYQQALPIYQQVKDRNGEAMALNNLGVVYQSLSQYDKAITYYQQALLLLQQVKDRNGEAKAFMNLGVVYQSLSQYDKAITYYQQSLPLFQQVKDRNSEALALNNLGGAYQSLAQYDKAIGYYQQALLIYQQVKDRNGEAMALGNLGLAYQSLSQYDKAIAYYQQSLPILQQVKNRNGEALALNNLGLAYQSLSQYDKAIAYYQQALPLLQQVKDRNGEALAFNNLGFAYLSLSQYDKAITYYQQALPIFQQVKDRQGEGLLLSNLGELLQKQKQPELAIVFYKQSVNVREGIREGIRTLPRDTQEAYIQSVAGTYRALADLLIDQGRIGEAQQVLERLKIQELNDFTKGTRAAASIDNVGYNAAETRIKTNYTSLIAFGSTFYDCEQTRCAQLEQLRTQYQTLNKEFQALVETIKKELRDRHLVLVDQATQDFQASADRVVTANPNALLIYPLVLPDKTRILWASKGGVLSKAAVCPLGEKALYGKVSQFRILLGKRGDLTQLKAVSKELYDCLIKPIEGELAATKGTPNEIRHLIVVPDRATNYIPLGALYDGNQYLIQRYAVSTILAASKTDTDDVLPRQPQQTPVLALGLSEARGTFGALPNVEAEINGILNTGTGLFPGQEFLNQKFDRQALENNLKGRKILHIATHGEFKPSNPRDSYFLLGTGTPYAIPDIQALRELRDVHLVVLSACETGLGGADGLGLEVAGISSFFLGDRDKAKAVMASLWLVNDASTSLLMQQFYQYLASGKLTKAEALRQAQLSLLNGKLTANDAPPRASVRPLLSPDLQQASKAPSDFAHPYYWAPFILIGNSL